MNWLLSISCIAAAIVSTQLWADLQSGLDAIERSDYTTAYKELVPVALSGDVSAQFNLGKLYFYGWGVKKDVAKAALWFHKAAEQGDWKSQKMLANMYEQGVGVEKNLREAEEWGRKAAAPRSIPPQTGVAPRKNMVGEPLKSEQLNRQNQLLSKKKRNLNTTQEANSALSCEDFFARTEQSFIDLSQIIILKFPKKGTPFRLANSVWTTDSMMQEYVPCKQTLHAWKDYFSITAFRGIAANPDWNPDNALSQLASQMEMHCQEGNFVFQILGKSKVDSYDASSAIIGCAKFSSDLPTSEKRGEGEIGYQLVIKAAKDGIFLWRAIRQNSFDPAYPPMGLGMLPEMPSLKICEDKSTVAETMTACSQRAVR